jgi:hypothetical protein
VGKTVYSYHPKTREFIGAIEARESPLQEGVYLIPANVSEVPPPGTGEHEVGVYDPADALWLIKPDYRGTVFYSTVDGREVKVTEIGALADVRPPDSTPNPMPTPSAGQKTVWSGTHWVFEDLPPPASVPARGARLALEEAGYLDAVEAALAAMPGSEGTKARIEWEYATDYQRDNPLIGKLAAALQLSDATLDTLFRRAAVL